MPGLPDTAEAHKVGRGYRPDVDGLRAIAVLGVVLFHANLGIPGGFTGVDVFFVISGFLITGIVATEVAAGSFSLVGFWERRARRIAPALFVVVLSCLVVGYFILLPFGYEVLGQTALTVVLLCSNVFFWMTNDYFSPDAKENALLHTWSLGVEEQFYLLYPFLLVLLVPRGRRATIVCLVLICLLSLWCSIRWVASDSAAAFYLLPSRAWELGIGGLAALCVNRASYAAREMQAWLGLLMIVASFLLLSKATPFPGLAAMPAVLGTTLTIWSGCNLAPTDQRPSVYRLLALRPLVFVGLISYALYLWHWPFFAFHRYVFGQQPAVQTGLIYVALAVLLSVASYHLVEQPIRQRKILRSRNTVLGFWGASSAAIAALGLALAVSDGFPFRVPASALDYANVQGQQARLLDKPAAAQGAFSDALGEDAGPAKGFLWGDSHAKALAPALDKVGKELGISIEARAMMGNAPVLGWVYEPEDSFAGNQMIKFNEEVFAEIAHRAEQAELEAVILVFRWARYIQRVPPLESSNPPPGFAEALQETARKLSGLGLKVIIMLEPPAFPVHVPRAFALQEFIGAPIPSLGREEVRSFGSPYASLLESFKEEGGGSVLLVDPLPQLISQSGAVRVLDEQGFLLFADDHHLSVKGALKTATGLKEALERAFRPNVPGR